MASIDPDKLQDFARRSPFKDVKGFDTQLWAAFVGTLRDLFQANSGVVQQTMGIPVVNPATGIVGGGPSTGTGNGTTANQTLDIASAAVPNTINAQVGNFIYRSGQSIGLADNRVLASAATDYVYATGPGILYVTPIYKAKNPIGQETDGRILMASGKGASSNAVLYLYRDGTATDDLSQITNSITGNWENGALFLQKLAIRTGTPRTLFVTGDIDIQRPGTG